MSSTSITYCASIAGIPCPQATYGTELNETKCFDFQVYLSPLSELTRYSDIRD